jgi:putative ubiquitin-RnfH superfamily antitoxin RatB of RatAB toxin-antitoxin module
MPAETVPVEMTRAETMRAHLVRVEVVYALPDRAWLVALELPEGAIASEALARAEFATQIPGFDVTQLSYAIFGKAVNATTVLRDGDRLEVLRPLIADPKQARRMRARKSGQ